MNLRTSDFFPQSYFRRHDERPDRGFNHFDRKEPYLDEQDQLVFHSLAKRLVRPGGVLLDLMAGAHSYLPGEIQPSSLTGIGLEAAQMARNPQINAALVQDLNQFPLLPFADDIFDSVLCTCGVQYLIQPVEVFSEVRRVLKPGGVFLVSFTVGCYPRKTIAIWLATRALQHQLLVRQYFEATANWKPVSMTPRTPHHARDASSLHAVWAVKK